MTRPVGTEAAQAPAKAPWGRRVFIAFVGVVGACEYLATSPSLDLDMLPKWLAASIAMIGFLSFLLLTGVFGNSAAAVALLVVAWKRWRWPLWRAVLLSLPFWIVAYRAAPKPW